MKDDEGQTLFCTIPHKSITIMEARLSTPGAGDNDRKDNGGQTREKIESTLIINNHVNEPLARL